MTVNHQKQLTVPPFAPSAKSSTVEQDFLNNPQRATVTENIFIESSTTGEISHDVDSIPLSSNTNKQFLIHLD